MEIEKIDTRKLKAAYILLAGLLALGAVASAFLKMSQYVTFALIVAASAVILAGAFLVSYLYKMQKPRDID
jgi:pilus assembly protein TadC